jgi:hypothetical protein
MKDKQNHLSWEWNKKTNYFIAYSVFLVTLIFLGFFFPDKKIGKSFSLFALVSYFTSMLIYKGTNVIGSMWCFFTVFASFLYFIHFKFSQK